MSIVQVTYMCKVENETHFFIISVSGKISWRMENHSEIELAKTWHRPKPSLDNLCTAAPSP